MRIRMSVEDLESLRIGGTEYAVKRVPGLMNGDGRCLMGQVDNMANVIQLSSSCGMDGQSEGKVILHEVIHAICYATGMDKLNDDEKTVDVLAQAFYALLADNMERLFYVVDDMMTCSARDCAAQDCASRDCGNKK